MTITKEMSEEQIMDYIHDNMKSIYTNDDQYGASVRQVSIPRLGKDAYKNLSSTLRYNSSSQGQCDCDNDCCGCMVSSKYVIEGDSLGKLKVSYIVYNNY